MFRLTRHSAAATLEMLPGGVLVVRFSGPLTGEALMHFKHGIVARHGPDIRAFVADYSRAGIALTGAELDAVLEGERPESAPRLPAAMVARAGDVRLLCGHAIRMAMHGSIRQVFTDPARAIRWAARYAAAGV